MTWSVQTRLPLTSCPWSLFPDNPLVGPYYCLNISPLCAQMEDRKRLTHSDWGLGWAAPSSLWLSLTDAAPAVSRTQTRVVWVSFKIKRKPRLLLLGNNWEWVEVFHTWSRPLTSSQRESSELVGFLSSINTKHTKLVCWLPVFNMNLK